MVRPVSRFFLVALLPVALSTCGLLNESVFPVDLPQAVAVRDFSARIPPAAAETFNLGVVQPIPGGSEWVILFSSTPYPNSPHLFVMDTNLAPTQQTMTYEDLAAAAGGNFSGSMVISDGWNRVVAGNLIFTPSGPMLDPNGGGIGLLRSALYSYSFGTVTWNFANLRTDGAGGLWYEKYPVSWAAAAISKGPWEISASTGLYLAAVMPWSTAEVILVFGEYIANDSPVFRFLRIPFMHFDMDSIRTPILTSYPGFGLKNLDSRLFGSTPDGIICYEKDSEDFLLVDPASQYGTVLKRQHLRVDNRWSQERTAYSAADGSRYTYDSVTRTVVKTLPWWKQ